MLKRKSSQKQEFNITVRFHRRTLSYRVKHQHVSEEEEVFNIITGHKTVQLTSRRPQFAGQGVTDTEQVYMYDNSEITNKCLMNRVIEAIDKQIRG